MASKIKVDLFLDLGAFIPTLTDLIGQTTSRGIVNTIKRRNKPRLTGDLMDDIQNDRLSFDEYEVMTDLPYSAAQELGRPDLESYTYTPYMEPGAVNGTAGNKMDEYISVATLSAANRTKI